MARVPAPYVVPCSFAEMQRFVTDRRQDRLLHGRFPIRHLDSPTLYVFDSAAVAYKDPAGVGAVEVRIGDDELEHGLLKKKGCRKF